MNGIEGNLAIAALYYFTNLKPVNFDAGLSKMTLLISICFLARSSSLAAWIPLAIFKILEDSSFFLPIVLAGPINTGTRLVRRRYRTASKTKCQGTGED